MVEIETYYRLRKLRTARDDLDEALWNLHPFPDLAVLAGRLRDDITAEIAKIEASPASPG